MPLFYDNPNDPKYAIVDGVIKNIKFYESVGNKGKPMAVFSVAYDYSRDDFDNIQNEYKNFVAWSRLAEFVSELKERAERVTVKVTGKVKFNEYKGEQREQIEATFIEVQKYSLTEETEPKPKQTKKDDWEEDIPF